MPDQLPESQPQPYQPSDADLDARLAEIHRRATSSGLALGQVPYPDYAAPGSPSSELPVASSDGPAGNPPTQLTPRQKAIELISWSAPNRIYDPKSPLWFLGIFAIALIGVIIFAILRDFMIILLIAAGLFVAYAAARVRPGDVDYNVYTTGIKVGGRMYGWKELQSFWLYVQHGTPMLRVDTKLYFPHTLEMLLGDIQAAEVEAALGRYLPMQERTVSEMGAMADSTILGVANKIPYRDKILRWIDQRIGYPRPNQSETAAESPTQSEA